MTKWSGCSIGEMSLRSCERYRNWKHKTKRPDVRPFLLSRPCLLFDEGACFALLITPLFERIFCGWSCDAVERHVCRQNIQRIFVAQAACDGVDHLVRFQRDTQVGITALIGAAIQVAH